MYMIKLGVLVLQYISCGAAVYVYVDIWQLLHGHVVYLNTCCTCACVWLIRCRLHMYRCWDYKGPGSELEGAGWLAQGHRICKSSCRSAHKQWQKVYKGRGQVGYILGVVIWREICHYVERKAFSVLCIFSSLLLQNRPVPSQHPLKGCRVHNRQTERGDSINSSIP